MKPVITSPANPQVKRVCAYQKKRKDRDRDGVFVAEGERLVSETPEEALLELYVSASYRAAIPRDMERFFSRHEACTQVVSDEVFAKMSDTKSPQGVLAVVKRRFPGLIRPDKGPVLLLEEIQDPGNLGTILRSSEAAGTAGVFLCGCTVDLYHPKTVRSTMGSIFRVPVRQDDEDIAQRFLKLKADGFQIVAADMAGTTAYDAYDWRQPTALVIGNEANGLSEEARHGADILLRIPMEGKNESLNAAVAASVLLFEAARQRRG